ncbi:MAG: Uncharacterised protein [Acidimicrobiales bacterium AG-410-I20]|nr:MAG: Uncharacterised protein [Acidimicrobiales bacterium AG-410-I20]
MPTYQYRCQTCNHEFEEKQSFADDPLTDCQINKCEGNVKKVFSGVGISFKGEGFYKNDHGSTSKKTGSSPAESTQKEKSEGTTNEPSSDSKEKPADSKSVTSTNSGDK